MYLLFGGCTPASVMDGKREALAVSVVIFMYNEPPRSNGGKI
ncbi:hypothetical protein bcere0022_24250 [Bacillus cereus Rock3-44]|nr:hypothetical protein bcere0022_24250 [Bacillus cereus Rock3-44]